MNILLIGEDAAGMQTLQALRRSSHRIVAVMASPSRQNRAGASLWNLAGKLGYTTWPAQSVKDPEFAAQIRAENVDIILNVHSLFLIHKEILQAPRLGAYNLHPGPLPRYAGLNSVCWAIYHGERQHGVTLHKMVPEIDAGPIVYQAMVDVSVDETGLSLTTKCVNAGIPLVLQLLDVAAEDAGRIPSIPQDLSQRQYFGREIPAQGNLTWQLPASQVVDFVRACDFFPFPSPWGHPRTTLGGRELGIVKAQLTGIPADEPAGTIGEASNSGVEVACGDEWILVREVFDGGKYRSAADVRRSGDRLGVAVEPVGAQERGLASTSSGASQLSPDQPIPPEASRDPIAYWRKLLDGRLPVLEWPTDRVRPAVITDRKATQTVLWPKDFLEQLKTLTGREATSLYTALLAGFGAVLQRYTGEEDIILGTPAAPGIDFLPVRIDLSGDPTFQDLLRRVGNTLLDVASNSDLPIQRLIEELQPVWDQSRHPFFQVAIALADLTDAELRAKSSKLDLCIEVQEVTEGIAGVVTYNPDLFEPDTIARALGHWRMLLEGAVADSIRPLSRLPLLKEDEQRRIVEEWNATEQPYPQVTVHELFLAQAQRTPDAIAVEMEGRRLTYRELNHRSNQLARHLRKLGVGPDVLVGLCLERSLEMVVGLLGILKSGGGYVPLDPAFPKHRLELMLEDARPPVVVTQSSLQDLLPQAGTNMVIMDRDREVIAGESLENLEELAHPRNLAYVLYTSGSTGKPKGVQIEHGCVVNFLISMQREPGLSSEDVLLAVTTLSFDISGLEIYLPLITGAKIVVASAETARDGAQLLALLHRTEATVLQATPATWRMLTDSGLRTLPRLKGLCGGEALPPELAVRLVSRVGSLWNLYGPTETTIWSTLCRVEAAEGPLTIGRPIANTQVYLFDAHLNPVPIGAIGDLYIGGDGVARGYMNRPDLTAEKFIPDPFSSKPGARLYKTGDLARYRVDGSIDFLGRSDNQVKVRGFRIELGEIETVLAQHPGLKAAVVMVREDTPKDTRLVAYVIPREGPTPAVEDLRQLLIQKLPRYMVPGHIIFLDVFPLTPNGKVDRRAFPAPDPASACLEEFVASRTGTEAKLVAIWEKLLGIHPISVQSSFFDLGGHSLLVTILLLEIERVFGKKLTVATIFEAETVEQLARILDQQSFQESSMVAIQKSGSNPPFFCLGAGPMFRSLARRFGPDQPFLGVRVDPAEWTHLSPPYHFEDLAEVFVKKIRAYQPEGPYYLGGFCLTGVVAYEVARQLIAQGQELKLLVLFYSYNPEFFARTSKAAELRLQVELAKFHLSNLRTLRGKEFLFYARDRITGLFEKLRPSAVETNGNHKFLPELEQIGVAAAHNYQPAPSPIPTVLFRPADDPRGQYWDRQYDWTRFVTAPMDVHITPGDHSSMFREPHVEVLADKMKAYLGGGLGSEGR
jgi:amino acid adenylation domain-containing protein